jgi:hypothetical protein
MVATTDGFVPMNLTLKFTIAGFAITTRLMRSRFYNTIQMHVCPVL